VARLVARIKQNVVFSDTLAGNPVAEVEVRAAANGTIIARRLVKSSGSPEWDDAVLRAIDRTGTLPRDTDGRVPGTLIVSFRAKE
jgi:colicin import membrane protein